MTSWTETELNKAAGAEALRIAPLRRVGTLGNQLTIWVVRVEDDLYVRSQRMNQQSHEQFGRPLKVVY